MQLRKREVEIVNFLADRYHSTDRMPERVGVQEIPLIDGESVDDIKNLLYRLSKIGLIKWATNQSIDIEQPLLEVDYALKNPPPRDYLKEWYAWWSSRPFWASILAAALVLPILIQWIEWVWQGVLFIRIWLSQI